jgi:N-acetylmuramoyl-L-alanine amidase CwlA
MLLTKYLMIKYKIDIDHVVRHYDVTQKYCPGIIGWNPASGDESKWLAFKEAVSGSLTTTTSLKT